MKNSSMFPGYLKIGTITLRDKQELFRIVTHDGSSVYSFDSKIITILSKVLGFSFGIHSQIGYYPANSLPNGSWPGLLGMLQREEIDIALGGMGVSYERNKIARFAFPHQFTDLVFITDNPQSLPKDFAVFYPFSWQVWITLLTLIFLMSYLFYEFMRRKYKFWNVLLTTFGSLLQESLDFERKRKTSSLKLLMLTWFVFVLLITSCYKSLILVSFSFPTLSGVRNINDLSRAGKDTSFRCFSTKGIYFALLSSNNEKFNSIAGCIARNLNISLRDFEHYLLNPTYKKAGIGMRSLLVKYKKDLYLSEENFFSSFMGIAVRKNFCCLEVLDTVIHRATAAGLFQKYAKDLEFSYSLKGGTSTSQTVNRNITLDDVEGAFVLLFVGEMISILVLLLEIIYWKKCNRRSF